VVAGLGRTGEGGAHGLRHAAPVCPLQPVVDRRRRGRRVRRWLGGAEGAARKGARRFGREEEAQRGNAAWGGSLNDGDDQWKVELGQKRSMLARSRIKIDDDAHDGYEDDARSLDALPGQVAAYMHGARPRRRIRQRVAAWARGQSMLWP
jgi:hypothetical protein